MPELPELRVDDRVSWEISMVVDPLTGSGRVTQEILDARRETLPTATGKGVAAKPTAQRTVGPPRKVNRFRPGSEAAPGAFTGMANAATDGLGCRGMFSLPPASKQEVGDGIHEVHERCKCPQPLVASDLILGPLVDIHKRSQKQPDLNRSAKHDASLLTRIKVVLFLPGHDTFLSRSSDPGHRSGAFGYKPIIYRCHQVHLAERFRVRRVISSSCSQPSPTKE
jgi:hypothetical protein